MAPGWFRVLGFRNSEIQVIFEIIVIDILVGNFVFLCSFFMPILPLLLFSVITIQEIKCCLRLFPFAMGCCSAARRYQFRVSGGILISARGRLT